MAETTISSFVLRFTQDGGSAVPWRGVVRHVQSNQELRFTRIEEALRFIGAFVALGDAQMDDTGAGIAAASGPD